MSVKIEVTELQAGVIKAQQAIETDFEYVPVPEGQAAVVTVGAGLTKNMGNYNSLKVEVRVAVPCHPTQIETVTDVLKTFCGQTVRSMVSKKEQE